MSEEKLIRPYNPSTIFARAQCCPASEWHSQVLKPVRVAKKIWRIQYPSLNAKYAGIFFLEYSLFLKAHSFSRAKLSEQTKTAEKYPSIYIFAPNRDHCLGIFIVWQNINKLKLSMLVFFSWFHNCHRINIKQLPSHCQASWGHFRDAKGHHRARQLSPVSLQSEEARKSRLLTSELFLISPMG